MSSDLEDFVRRALEARLSREEIARALAAAKWPEAEIKAALGAWSEVPFAIPVPRPRPYLSARDVFTYVVLFGALYASVWSVVALLFEVIDRWLPDAAIRSYDIGWSSDNIRWDIAGLAVTFPLFMYVLRVVDRRMAADPTARESRPRKWLTYLTLALSVCALASDLATLVYKGLGGDLTAPLLLKVLVVALVAGGTFLYFHHDVKERESA